MEREHLRNPNLKVVHDINEKPQISVRSVFALVLYICGWVIGLIWIGTNFIQFLPLGLGLCFMITGVLAGFE